MKFTTPCVVRVENADERDALIAWCANIGYETNDWNLPAGVCYVFAEGFFAGRCGEKALGGLPTTSIDCGTDVELFKALAAMNDESDREQWFVNDLGLWRKVSGDKSIGFTADEHDVKHFFRKATVEEIIEHFKNR